MCYELPDMGKLAVVKFTCLEFIELPLSECKITLKGDYGLGAQSKLRLYSKCRDKPFRDFIKHNTIHIYKASLYLFCGKEYIYGKYRKKKDKLIVNAVVHERDDSSLDYERRQKE